MNRKFMMVASLFLMLLGSCAAMKIREGEVYSPSEWYQELMCREYFLECEISYNAQERKEAKTPFERSMVGQDRRVLTQELNGVRSEMRRIERQYGISRITYWRRR